MPEKKRRWYIPVVIAPVAVALISGCTFTGTVTAGGASPVAGSEPLTSSSAPPKASTKKPETAAKNPGTTEESAPAKTQEKAEHRPEKPAGPAIEYFRVKQKPTCESGTDAVRYPGQPVILEWNVEGAEKTALSVDGPGIYAEYGAKDSAMLDFPCAGVPNSYVSHRYTLTVTTGHTTRTRTIHVKARVNEIASL